MEFRKLRADEIDCRVGTISTKGFTLLLYKDARCDMAILDETVGPENWQRRHEVINNNLFCSVGIHYAWETGGGEWVWKQDVGTESNTEKEKGEASDAFKRACVNWGIGRELYTAPFIWVSPEKATIDERNGKAYLKDKLIVKGIDYNDQGRISALIIWNASRNTEAFSWYEGTLKSQKKAEKAETLAQETLDQLQKVLDENGIVMDTIRHLYKVNELSELTQKKAENILAYIPDIKLTQRKSELKAIVTKKKMTEAKACASVGKSSIRDLTAEETEKVLKEVG